MSMPSTRPGGRSEKTQVFLILFGGVMKVASSVNDVRLRLPHLGCSKGKGKTRRVFFRRSAALEHCLR
jgi:hypothetical protein